MTRPPLSFCVVIAPCCGVGVCQNLGLLWQICGKSWWTSTMLKWSCSSCGYPITRSVHVGCLHVRHEHASFKTIVYWLTHEAFAVLILFCVCAISRLSVLSGEADVPCPFIHHRIHSQRIVSAMQCLVFQKALDALFFFFFSNSHRIRLAWLESQLSTLFTCEIKWSEPQRSSQSHLFFCGNKILSVWLSFRVT